VQSRLDEVARDIVREAAAGDDKYAGQLENTDGTASSFSRCLNDVSDLRFRLVLLLSCRSRTKTSSVKCREHNFECLVGMKSLRGFARIYFSHNSSLYKGNTCRVILSSCLSAVSEPVYPLLQPNAAHLYTIVYDNRQRKSR